ncbi:MAG: single-stranded-DNA-specific exonuclease RecJ [Clostridia bacterium]
MNKKWECYPVDEEKVEQIAQKYQIGKLLANILVNRNIVEEKKITTFLEPTRNDFYNPFLMPDMEKAVNRILQAIQKKEKIMIYGDYDVDGITSITVLKKFMQERGALVADYIPNRLEEGYGLNKPAIQSIVEQGYSLMVTVDCGISAIEEVAYGNALGLETIVTDHHEPGENLPDALAVVDAKRKDSIYPFNQLAGVGVVFKVIQAISQKLQLPEKEYLKYLDIVCVGTISDIVPLVDENRVIAKLGLKLVEVTKNVGLRTLLELSGYKQVDSNTISFGIAPRINACGRMGKEREALNLFLTTDPIEARNIANRLNAYNKERQDTEKEIFKQAVEQIEQASKESEVIVLGDSRWHHGVIGIVSSKITEKYFKPSVLICFEENEGKGSGRSIPGFDLFEALSHCQTYLDKFGGHSMAVGVSVKKENFEKFKKEFEEYAHNSAIHDIIPIIPIDKEVTLKDIQMEQVKELSKLEPFGEANKTPLFLYRNLKIQAIRALSEGKHLKLTLKDEHFFLDGIGFNLGDLTQEYCIGDKVDVVGTLEINSFGGRQTIQMNIKDMMKSASK